MSDYTIVWDDALPGPGQSLDIDGPNSFTSVNDSNDTVLVTISTPVNGTGDQFGLYGQVGQGSLESDFPDDPAVTVIDFHEDVADVQFKLYDIDGAYNSSSDHWDDKVTVVAVDFAGHPVAPIYGNITHQIVTGNSIEGNGDDPGGSSFVTVSFAVPIAHLTITFEAGPDDPIAGYIGIGDISFNEAPPGCFVRGTLIETDRGEVAVEALMADDLVRTADNGFQPIRWIGSTTVKAKGSKAPILFRKGVIGNSRDLMLSPAHRVMLEGWQAELLFGGSQFLASAKSLVNDSTIIRQESDTVDYFHILFDRHEIVFSDGAPTESFHPGQAESGVMAQAARAEILSLFPELEHNSASYGPAARGSLTVHEAALLNL